MADKYFIWQRNDGHIDVSVTAMPRDYVTGGAEPEKGSTVRVGAGEKVTFEMLGEFDNFPAAKAFGEACRKVGRLQISHNFPPVLTNAWDYSAYDDSTYDGPGSKQGVGPTVFDAVCQLLDDMEIEYAV